MLVLEYRSGIYRWQLFFVVYLFVCSFYVACHKRLLSLADD